MPSGTCLTSSLLYLNDMVVECIKSQTYLHERPSIAPSLILYHIQVFPTSLVTNLSTALGVVSAASFTHKRPLLSKRTYTLPFSLSYSDIYPFFSYSSTLTNYTLSQEKFPQLLPPLVHLTYQTEYILS